MINFKLLEIQSFKSIFNATLDFDAMQGKFYSLEGKNETIDFAASNGSGKTTCLNALAYAIYGTTLDVFMKAEEYQNKNTSIPLTLSLVFGVQIGNESEQLYTVIRTLKSVKLYKGEEDISELTKTATERKLQDIIQITKDEFFSFTYLTQYDGGNFLNKTASEKLAAIREFVFGQELYAIKLKIDGFLKELNRQCNNTNSEISKISGSIDSLLDILEKDESAKTSITEEKYEENKKTIQTLRDKLAEADSLKFERQSLRNKYEDYRRQIAKLKEQLLKIKQAICPTCGQVLPDDKSEQLRFDLLQEGNSIKEKALPIKEKIQEIEKLLSSVEVEAPAIRQNIEDLTKENNDYLASVKLIERQEYAKANIDSLQETIKTLEKRADKLEDKVKTIKALQKYFNTTFVQEVQQTFLTEIQNYLNLYCYDMFEEQFELKFTGTNLELLIGGKPYSYFSGGERQRIDFIFVFAIKVILLSFTDKCTNLFLADESLSAQDYQSFENCLDLVKRLSESSGLTTILVSHRETSNISQNRIVLTRKNDSTKLEVFTA